MAEVTPVPAGRFEAPSDFRIGCEPDDLVYFLLNVGDGDSQVLLLPDDGGGRRTIVVDIARAGKTLDLFDALQAGPAPLISARPDLVAVVALSHPHLDHIGGMAAFADRRHEQIDEVWESAYYHPSPAYFDMMKAIEKYGLRHLQPTSGTARYIGPVKVTVLAPGIGLRNRFDSYGVDTNNASITLKIEYPMNRYLERDGDRAAVKLPKPATLILGADAQTASWAQVMGDFPQLGPEKSAVAAALRKARGVEPLKAHLFKVPHHGSKHGASLELVEQIDPGLNLVSSDLAGSKHGFPHRVALEQIREAVDPSTSSGKSHPDDWELGLHFTCGSDDEGEPLGSIAVVFSKTGQRRDVWRFGDEPGEPVDLAKARRFK